MACGCLTSLGRSLKTDGPIQGLSLWKVSQSLGEAVVRAIPMMMKLGLRLFKLPKPPEALVRAFAVMLKPSLRLFQLLKPREALDDAGPQCTCAFDPEDDYAAPAQAAMPACTSIPAAACSSRPSQKRPPAAKPRRC